MPRQVDATARRREIAFGVLQVMTAQDISAVSLRSVAAAAGVSMGRVQHYFATKDELIEHACRTITELAEENFRAVAEATALEQLRHLLLQALPRSDEQRRGLSAWYMFTTAAPGHPGLAAIMADAWAGQHRQLVALLAEINPQLDRTERDRRAQALAATVDGLNLRLMLDTMTTAQATTVVNNLVAELVTPAEPGRNPV